MSTRVQIRRGRRRKGPEMADVLPLVPRDLEVLRAKAMLRATGRPGTAGPSRQRKA
jgi:hypothetical protein